VKSAEYWRTRFEQLEARSNAYGVETFREVEKALTQAQVQIQKEIDAWYGRFALNNNVTLADAKKMLTARELKELKWDVEEYIKRGRENALNQAWMKELENASARVHINRLEALKIRTQHAAEVAFGGEMDAVDAMARRVFTEDYYHTIYEYQKGFNIGWEVGAIDERKLEKLMKKPWAADGKNFSDRIWQQKRQLVNELHTQLVRTCILGKAPDNAIKAISKKFDVTKHQAGRLVMTEQAYFHSVAQKEAFADLDVGHFEIVATLDSHTSPMCREMDGKVFPMSEYQPGVTAPPFHVWCRSVTVPWFDDDFDSDTKRIARASDGRTYYVPSNMTYKQWAKENIIDANYGIYGKSRDAEQFDRYVDVLKELSPKSLKEFINIKYNDEGRYKDLKRKYGLVNQYKVDSGEMSAQEILDLDRRVITEKRSNFPSAYKTSGNIAGAYIDDEEGLFLAHSRIDDTTDKGYKNYKGEAQIVPLQPKFHYEYIDVKDASGAYRYETFFDTEAKLFEEFHNMLQTRPIKQITMLSERGMCDSCKNVMEQFKKEHPDVEIRVVSNKKVEGDVWGTRMVSEEKRQAKREKYARRKKGEANGNS
jgi:SPP1 gp7 family putative phage head morphogenesis protein